MNWYRHARNWLREYGSGTFRSWDFALALYCGVAAGAVALVDDVRDEAVTILIAETAIGAAITSTVFGALAIFTALYDGPYRRALELAGGFRRALMPYIVVGVIAACAGIVGLLGALAMPALGEAAAAPVVGLATLLCAWTLTGLVSVTELTLFHASQRASLMGGADEAASIRAQRLRERAERRDIAAAPDQSRR